MFAFPEREPVIAITRLDEPPFDITLQELPGWVNPTPGQRKVWAEYHYPGWKLKEIEEVEVLGRCMVHEEPYAEIRCREHRPDGTIERDRFAYAEIREGMERWFGWWNMADELKFYTYTDRDFAWDWGEATPMRTQDVGRIRWLDESHIETVPGDVPTGVNPNGAGTWLLKIGEIEHRCFRYLDGVDWTEKPHVLGDRFVDASGRMLLRRHYYWSDFRMSDWPGPSKEVLKDAPTMSCNGTTFYLWYDRLAEESLGSS